MSHYPVVDGLEFARTGSKLHGAWPVGDFSRLRDALCTDAGTLQYELLGVPEDRGRLAFRLRVSGVLQLVCQRCLLEDEVLLAIPLAPRHESCAGWLAAASIDTLISRS